MNAYLFRWFISPSLPWGSVVYGTYALFMYHLLILDNDCISLSIVNGFEIDTENSQCIKIYSNGASHILQTRTLHELEKVQTEQDFSARSKGVGRGVSSRELEDLSAVPPNSVPPNPLSSSLRGFFAGATSESESTSWTSCSSRKSRTS
jgi:hypothetical protein